MILFLRDNLSQGFGKSELSCSFSLTDSFSIVFDLAADADYLGGDPAVTPKQVLSLARWSLTRSDIDG